MTGNDGGTDGSVVEIMKWGEDEADFDNIPNSDVKCELDEI